MKDLQLWQALKRGDKQALEQIYSEHISALLKYGRKFTADNQLVEDCVQDLFIELWKNKAKLSETDSIRKYLFVSLRRKVIRQLDRVVKKIASMEPEDYHFEAEMAIEEQLINIEIATEKKEQLQQALKNLSKRQQEALYLKYFSDMDYKDIAEVMSINYQSTRNLVFNALKALRKVIVVFWMMVTSDIEFLFEGLKFF